MKKILVFSAFAVLAILGFTALISSLNGFAIVQTQLSRQGIAWQNYFTALRQANADYRTAVESARSAYDAEIKNVVNSYNAGLSGATAKFQDALDAAKTKTQESKALKNYQKEVAAVKDDYKIAVEKTLLEWQAAQANAAKEREQASLAANAQYLLGIAPSKMDLSGADLAASVGSIVARQPSGTPEITPAPEPSDTPSEDTPTPNPSKTLSKTPKPTGTPSVTPVPTYIPISTPTPTPTPTPATPTPTVTPPSGAETWDWTSIYSNQINLGNGDEKDFIVNVNSDRATLTLNIYGLNDSTNAKFFWTFPDGRIFPGVSGFIQNNVILGTTPIKMYFEAKSYNPSVYTANIPDQYIPQGIHTLKLISQAASSSLQFMLH